MCSFKFVIFPHIVVYCSLKKIFTSVIFALQLLLQKWNCQYNFTFTVSWHIFVCFEQMFTRIDAVIYMYVSRCLSLCKVLLTCSSLSKLVQVFCECLVNADGMVSYRRYLLFGGWLSQLAIIPQLLFLYIRHFSVIEAWFVLMFCLPEWVHSIYTL